MKLSLSRAQVGSTRAHFVCRSAFLTGNAWTNRVAWWATDLGALRSALFCLPCFGSQCLWSVSSAQNLALPHPTTSLAMATQAAVDAEIGHLVEFIKELGQWGVDELGEPHGDVHVMLTTLLPDFSFSQVQPMPRGTTRQLSVSSSRMTRLPTLSNLSPVRSRRRSERKSSRTRRSCSSRACRITRSSR